MKIKLTAAMAPQVNSAPDMFPWNQIGAGLDFEVIGGVQLNGAGVVLVCRDPAITISGWQVEALLGDHPAIHACREDTDHMIATRSRVQHRLAHRRLCGR